MQTVEHIVTAQSVSAQSVEDEFDCHVTKEEMIDTIIAAIKAQQSENLYVENRQPAKLQSLGLAEEIAKTNESSGTDYTRLAVIGVIVAELIGLGYMIFGM